MKRQAFVVMAHNRWEMLFRLLERLDDSRFDVYLHIDADSMVPDGVMQRLESGFSNLTLLQRHTLFWGDVSIVDAEICCFAQVLASGREYSHIHLLSGQDLPIKSNSQIMEFFNAHDGQEFLEMVDDLTIAHVRCVNIFTRDFGYKPGRSHVVYRIRKSVNKLLHALEKMILMHKWYRRRIDFRKGSQWVSVTPRLAGYIVDRREEIVRFYRRSFAPDEFFVQTTAWNSEFKDYICDKKTRYIVWERKHTPHPRTFTVDDFDSLTASEACFARKFDSDADSAVIDMIYDYTEE